MPATPHTRRLLDGLRRQLEAITDQQVRDLVAAWARAWDEVAPDLLHALLDLAAHAPDGNITRQMVVRSSRMQQALAVIADQLHNLADATGVRLTQDLDEIIRQAGEAQAAIIASQLPSTERLSDLDGWGRVDARQVEAVVKRSTEQILSRTKPLGVDAYDVVRRELVRGIAGGTNPRATAQRIVDRAEQAFNGGLNRALVIARTEMLDAHREAARVSQQQNADVLAGWEWSARLDVRTCPACWSKNGTVHDLEEPGPLGHQQCRCARLPKLKPWADLGLDVDEPPDAQPDADALFAQLPEHAQRQILGPARWEAWREGRFPMSQWAVRRRTPGWRDSFHVAPAPKGSPARPARRSATPRSTTPAPRAATPGPSSSGTPQLDALARKSGPWTLQSDIDATNPNYGQPGYDNNCVHVVAALELRRSGYDVQATALPAHMRPRGGRNAVEALRRWVDENGDTRTFVNVTRADITREVRDWGDGSVGWVVVRWRGNAGGHIFTVINEGGKVRFVDAQNPAVNTDDFWPHVQRGSILLARVDDLRPTDTVVEFVETRPKKGKA